MAIIVDTSGFMSVAGVDLSDHIKKVTVAGGQETREVTAMGKTYKVSRAGLGTPKITAELFGDAASGSVNATLRALIAANTSGVTVLVKEFNTATTVVNPSFTMDGIIDGDLNVVDAAIGEVPMVSVTFVPFSTYTVSTSAS